EIYQGGGAEINPETAPDLHAAGRDPVHHLRLFSNYLIPRRGLLSGDSWSAIAYITRNIGLTWVILLPILLALMLMGQLYFLVGGGGSDFYNDTLRWDYFGPRLLRLAYVLAPLAGWLVVLSAIYAAASAEPDHLSSRFAPDWKERWRRRISSGQWWVFIL